MSLVYTEDHPPHISCLPSLSSYHPLALMKRRRRSSSARLALAVPGPALADDLFFSTYTYLADDRPEVQAFIDDYTALFGHPPENSFAPLGYDAIGLIANAIEQAGEAEPAAIRAAMTATRDYPAVTGTISYTRPTMVPPKPVSIISVHGAEFNVEEIWRPD